MLQKMHPIHWLPRFDNTLTQAVQDDLDRNCSEKSAGEDDGQFRYTFHAKDVNDHYDRVVVVSAGRFQVLTLDHCQCSEVGRHVLDCQCVETRCSKCGSQLLALSSVCDVGGNCMYDACGYCAHYRDVCYAADVSDTIKSNAAALKSENVSWAEAYYQAIADELGEGCDAPYFDAARRVLNDVSKVALVDTATGCMDWELPDGTHLYTRDKVWIHCDE